MCVSDGLMAAEYKAKNIVVLWNAVYEDEDQAKRIFTEISTEGLNLPVIPHFTVFTIKKIRNILRLM